MWEQRPCRISSPVNVKNAMYIYVLQPVLLKTDAHDSLQSARTPELPGWHYYAWKDCWRSWELYASISSTRLKWNVVQMSLQRKRHTFLEGEGEAEKSISNNSRTWSKWFICNYIQFMNTREDSQTISLYLMSWLETMFQLHWFGAATSISL